MINKKYLRLGTSLLILVIICNFVSAFAVSCTYYRGDSANPGNPLRLYAGNNQEIKIILQNPQGTDDMYLQAIVSSGLEVISLPEGETYIVHPGEQTIVPIKVHTPPEAQVGTVYPVDIKFTTVSNPGSGAFSLGSSISHSFDVIIDPLPGQEQVPKSPSYSTSTILAIVLGIILLIIIIWLVSRKKNKKRK